MWWIGPLVHAGGALFAEPAFAEAHLPAVEVRCARLTREQTAEVEARARADLMTSGLSVLEADLECSSDRVTVTVSSERASKTHTAALYDQNLREALIEALETALLGLMHPEPTSPLPARSDSDASETTDRDPRPTAPEAPPPPTVPGGAPASHAPLIPSRREDANTALRNHAPHTSSRVIDVGAGAVVEWWQDRAAGGLVLDAGYGNHSLSLHFSFTALTEVQKAEAFAVLELSAALGLRFQPAWSEGARLSASVGASWLHVAPEVPYAVRGGTEVAAAFALLELSRPIGFGSWSLVPNARVRLFGAERDVNLDGRPQLVIGHVAPGLAVELARSFE